MRNHADFVVVYEIFRRRLEYKILLQLIRWRCSRSSPSVPT